MTAELERRFTNHTATPDQQQAMEHIRDVAKSFALLIERVTPPGRERAEAVKHCELAMFWGNAGVARPKAEGGRPLTMATPDRSGLSAPPILSEPQKAPPTTPGYYRGFIEGTGWVVVHVTEVSGVLWSEWLGTEELLARDQRFAAWDHTEIVLPKRPPTITLGS